YEKLIENTQTIANVGGWELNLQSGSVFATSCALDILNAKESDDLTPPKVIHKFKDSARFKFLLGQTIRKAVAFDELFETKDVPPKYIRTVAKPVLKGDKIYKISGIYQDVTELKKKDSFLTLFKTIIDNVEDLIYVYNDKGDLLHYSKSLMDKLGYTKEEL